MLAATTTVFAQGGNGWLTNAEDVISLPPERAALSLPVVVRGTVTAADPALKGRFFIQDTTGGVFVDNANGERPSPGDILEVTGITHPGAFAPIITAPKLVKLGTGPLPTPKSINIERLISGAEDSQRIEISGTIRDARNEGGRLAVDLAAGGYRFRAYIPPDRKLDPQRLIAAEVRVRGTAAESHNRSLRHLISPEIYVPVPGDFVVSRFEDSDPFRAPVIPLNSVAQYRQDVPLNQRVHVRGILTLQRPGEDLFLEDGTGGLRVQSHQWTTFQPGDAVEAVGFPGIEQYLPVLEDAVLRKTDGASVTLQPSRITVSEILGGLHHADYVCLNAKAVDRTTRVFNQQRVTPAHTRATLVLQSSNVLFTAESDQQAGVNALASVPLGSIVEVSGVCLTEINADGAVDSFRILLASPNAVRILRQPSWLTPQRLLIGLTAAILILILVASWSVMVSKRNSTLQRLVREKEHAQVELQRAHDELDNRVRERTEQLQFQITARKEAQLQFRAVLTERTRLAQELHDTLEQTLTGIALQMDAASKSLERAPADTDRFLEMARNMVTQGQIEVRRSVWDLRSRALEQFNLPSALQTSAKEATNGTGIHVAVEARGLVRPLPEIIEENLLRIAQESVTNVVKHSGATTAKVLLDYAADSVRLEIEDNGKGFSTTSHPGPAEGHFGLLGIRERATRLRGQASFQSTPGKGTLIRLDVPVDPTGENHPPAPNNDDANAP
ncbi:MAG TPA: histidine kinase [Verrucomicrobiae bacterium]|nr:histidine kinase [Verrucomicrobiae bacterium]